MKSTGQNRYFHTYVNEASTAAIQSSRYETIAYDYIDMTTPDVRIGTITFNTDGIMTTTHDNHGTYAPKDPPHDTYDLPVSVGEHVSADSSVSRILDDVMSIDTFPCTPAPLSIEDKIVNWLDIPLEITCIQARSDLDDEEISMADSCQMDTTTRSSSRMVAHLFTPVANVFHRHGQWHFDIESVESEEMSIETVATWSLSEDFS
jgi:hypothetical protein